MNSLEQRTWARLEQQGDCWLWTGARLAAGYGVVQIDGRPMKAHRWAYEQLRGEIPDGLHVDHLCLNPPCCNPWHMDLVTPQVNTARMRAMRPIRLICKRGHYVIADNVKVYRGRRECVACLREKAKTRWQLKKLGLAS